MMKKVSMEFTCKASPKSLYSRLSTASGLSEWFADDVRVNGKEFTFQWDGAEQVAKLTLKKENQLVRFEWVDNDEGGDFFEFKIEQDELTGDVALIVTDFADEGEEDELQELWDSQIADLKHIVGG